MTTCDHPLFGGVTLERAREIHQEAVAQPWARKNLFHVTVDTPLALGSGTVNIFNLFCTGAEYSPVTLTGEKRPIGTAVADILKSREAVDLRLTTLDDTAGTLKSWFTGLSTLAAPSDGTVNVPADFATRFTIRHAFIEGDTGFVDRALFRPGTLEISLSRAEHGMQELTMTFVQLDTFMLSTYLPWA